MRFIWLAVCAVIMPGIWGCGGNASSTTPATSPSAQFGIVSGNWGFSMLSTGPTFFAAEGGGNLVQNGTSISGIIHLTGLPCFDPLTDDLIVSGTATGGTTLFGGVITFKTAPIRGQTITFLSSTLIGTIPGQNQVLNGSFTLDGGTCAPGTQGPMSGTVVSSVTGNWISGNLAFTGSPCFTSGTITSGSILGTNASLTITTNDGGQMVFLPQLPSQVTGSGLHGLYEIVTGACSFDSGDGLLTKQP